MTVAISMEIHRGEPLPRPREKIVRKLRVRCLYGTGYSVISAYSEVISFALCAGHVKCQSNSPFRPIWHGREYW